ncbi:MAG TPA: putative PEP-binding protein, partial [Virgibacillus sp.]|nr:putative PEP-binding protein [Virgibacillus sp.]
GTNDLIQFTLAMDRMNERVSHLYQPYHPAVLNLINKVVQAAHQVGKPVGICGEMAGDPWATPILLGLGLDEFSMTASSILRTRAHMSEMSKKHVETLANDVLTMSTAEEVLSHTKAHINI